MAMNFEKDYVLFHGQVDKSEAERIHKLFTNLGLVGYLKSDFQNITEQQLETIHEKCRSTFVLVSDSLLEGGNVLLNNTGSLQFHQAIPLFLKEHRQLEIFAGIMKLPCFNISEKYFLPQMRQMIESLDDKLGTPSERAALSFHHDSNPVPPKRQKVRGETEPWPLKRSKDQYQEMKTHLQSNSTDEAPLNSTSGEYDTSNLPQEAGAGRIILMNPDGNASPDIKRSKLIRLYKEFILHHKIHRFPKEVHGSQLNRIQGIIYIYAEQDKSKEVVHFVQTDKYLQSCPRVEIIEIPAPENLSDDCLNCNKASCPSLQVSGTNSWVGLGSVILALEKSLWETVQSKRRTAPHKFRKIGDIVQFLRETGPRPTTENPNRFCKRWSVGTHMQQAKTFSQVFITTYHSLLDCEPNTDLVFLTEVTTEKDQHQIKVLSNKYTHKPIAEFNDSLVMQYKPENGSNLLVLEIHEEIKNLLTQPIADCDSTSRRLILRKVEDHEDLQPGHTVRKCGDESGNTYGKVISTDVNFRNPDDGLASTAAFSVGSRTTNRNGGEATAPFARMGDSGSLVFEREELAENVIQYKAHGLVWCRFNGVNDSDGRVDPKATACTNLRENLDTLKNGPYEELVFPPPNPSGDVHDYNASIAFETAIDN